MSRIANQGRKLLSAKSDFLNQQVYGDLSPLGENLSLS
jgi:hypothetical protein